jgi:hypothetical protein
MFDVSNTNILLINVTCQINGMNGKMVANKPLYVGLHQPKDQRRAMLTVCDCVPTVSFFFQVTFYTFRIGVLFFLL